MIKVAILCPYPLHQAPSQRFRFEQYLTHLSSRGIQCTVFPFLNDQAWNLFYTHGKPLRKSAFVLQGLLNRFVTLFRLRKFDVVFIHREAAPIGPPLVEWWIAKVLRKPLIYDFDDAIWLPNYSPQHRKVHRMKAYWKVKHIIRWSSKVSVGNAFLAEYARSFTSNVEIIPTTIDTALHNAEANSVKGNPFTVGWTGTHTTVAYLDALLSVLTRLASEVPIEFVVISNEPPPFMLPNLTFIPWNKATEIEDLARIDVGIMPLNDDDWSRGKCGFKALQYMALGIPTVASKVGVNSEIIQHGVNGFLAETSEEWYALLMTLYNDRNLCKVLGEAGKRTVEERYSVEANSGKYEALFRGF